MANINETISNGIAAAVTTPVDYEALIAALKQENAKLAAEAAAARLRAQQSHVITPKVSEKGAMSVYGLGKFPVTLYREQWERLFAQLDRLKAFMVENDALLVRKAPKV